MPKSVPPVALFLLLGTAATLGLTALVQRRRKTGSGQRFLALLLATAGWELTSALIQLTPLLPAKIMLAQLQYLFIPLVPPLWLQFVLEYTHLEGRLTPVTRRAIWTIQGITALLAFTNAWHHLIWSRVILVHDAWGPRAVFGHGLWFWVAAALNYLLMLIGTCVMVRRCLDAPPTYARQTRVLLLGAVAPWIGNALYLTHLLPVPGLDLTPVAFSLSAGCWFWAIFRLQLFDVAPVARDIILERLRDGVLVLDRKGRIVDCNPAARELCAAVDGDLIGHEVQSVFPDWPSLATHLASDLPAATETRLSGPSARYVDVHVSPLPDRGGRITGRLVVLRDVTERRHSEEELRRLKEFNESILRQMSEGVVVENADGNFTFVNPAAAALLGFEPHDLLGRHRGTIVPYDPLALSRPYGIRSTDEAPTRYEVELVRGDGSRFPALMAVSQQRDLRTAGSATTIRVFYDITDRKLTEKALNEYNARLEAQLAEIEALQSELREQAIRDPLTALYNRRYMEEALSSALAVAARDGAPVSVVLVDIDHFKQLNDTYGHEAGDRVLLSVADLLRRHVREGDVACRFGGEEFLLVLSGASTAVARLRAEQWRSACEALRIPFRGELLSATLSLGVATYHGGPRKNGELLRAADQALYMAKSTGRNRVRVATDLEDGGRLTGAAWPVQHR